MKDTSKAKQSLALLGALVMLVSMVATGFAGSAAASTSTIDNVTVQNDPVNVGGTVTQTIDLTKIQNDDSDGTVTVSANDDGNGFNGDNFVFQNPSVNEVSNHYEGETSLSSDDIAFSNVGGTSFDIDLQNAAQNESVDLTVDVEIDLSSYAVAGSNDVDTVRVDATTDGSNTKSDTFDLVPAQPELTVSGVSTVQPDLVTVSTSNTEEIKVSGVSNPEDAFTLDSAGFDQATEVVDVRDSVTAVDGSPVGDAVDEVVVVLDNPVTSNASDPITEALSYDGSDAVVNSQNPDVNANSTGTALDVPTTGVAPTFISANVGESVDTSVVDADNQNRVVEVVFSEDVAAKGDAQTLAGEFTWGGDTQSVNSSSDAATNVAGNVVTLTLDAAVAPDENTESTKSDLSASTLNDQLQSATGSSTTDAATFSGQAVENNVAPVIQDSNTQVTASSPDQLEVAFNGNIQKVTGVSDAQVADAFSITGDASVDSYSGINGNVVTLNLDPIQSAGDAETVSYSASTDVIESAAANNPTPANASDGEVTNNAVPVSDSATLNSDRDQITISFSEAVTFADSVNPDVIATDDFEFKGADSGSAPAIYQGATDGNGNVVLTLDGTLSEDAEVSVDYTNNNDAIISESTGADPVQGFSEQVGNNNLISSADITYTTDADDVGGTYTATVTFAQDISQVGTDSEVASAFDIDSTEASISTSGSDVNVDEANNQITFTVTEGSNINSGTDFAKSNTNGLQYTASVGNNPLNAGGSALSNFDTSLTNNVVPVIDAEANPATTQTPAHLKVEDGSRKQLVVYFSEDVDAEDAADGSSAFGFTGSDAPTITNLEDSDDEWDGPTNAVRLTFESDVAPDDNLGELTYDGSSVVNSNADLTAAQEPDIDLTVAKGFGATPAIQKVVFDDVSENTNDDQTGEMLLYFDSDVNAQKDNGDDTTGLTFNSDSTDVSINVDGIITDSYNEQPDNVVAVKFSSASGSVSSLVREGDEFGSNAELVVTPGDGLDITYDDTGNNIASTNVQAENIHNEIAGDLSEVSETSSDIEILGADVDEQTGSYDVTVSGLSDGNYQVLDEGIVVNVAGDSTSLTADEVEDKFRFDDQATVQLNPDTSVDSNIGETVPINVTTATGTELTPNTAAQVDIVHEARTTSPETSGTFIISQPQPGELVADSGIGAITSYNASSGEMENYVNMDATDRVHRGIFIDGNGTGNVYGFAYETESANVGGTTAEMPEGWNVVGSNAALSDSFPNTYDEDLRFDTSPAASSDDVRIFATDSVDTNNVGTTIQSAVNHDTSGVSEYDGYYVYMHESNDRVIIEPGYSSGDAPGSVA